MELLDRHGKIITSNLYIIVFLYTLKSSTKIQDRVDVSAPKLSTIKYLECENHVSEEFFLWYKYCQYFK